MSDDRDPSPAPIVPDDSKKTSGAIIRGLRHQRETLNKQVADLREQLAEQGDASQGEFHPSDILRDRNLQLAANLREITEGRAEDATKYTEKIDSLLVHFSKEKERRRKRHHSRLASELEASLRKLAGKMKSDAEKAERATMRRAEGILDEVTTVQVKGWAWNPKLPEEHLEVQLVVDGEVIETTYADIPRADVLREGIGDGHYGFRFKTPRELMDGEEKEWKVEVANYENRINNSPRLVTLRKAGGGSTSKIVADSRYDLASGGDDPRAAIHVPGSLARAVARGVDDWDKVSIIIPVYNAPDDLRACLASVLTNTGTEHEVVIVDDCSPDPEIAEILKGVKNNSNVRLLKTKRNLGFVGAVNFGLKSTTCDVVLLNSDTIVPPRWLLRLRVASESDPRVGTVTPLTNAGGAFSIPEYAVDAPLPEDLSVQAAARLVARSSRYHYGEIPTGNGFCLYIRRAALDEVGLLDEETFGRGYGEENDLCMRMRAEGWTHILDDSSFVYHRGHASFGAEGTAAQLDTNLDLLYDRYPEYRELVAHDFHTAGMKLSRQRIADAWNCEVACADSQRPRLLAVLHEGEGGVLVTAEDIYRGLPAHWEKFLLTSDGQSLYLREYFEDEFLDVAQWSLPGTWSASSFQFQAWQDVYSSVLIGLDIDLVHIHHLFKHSFDLPALCKEFGIPYLLSVHDFYFITPSLQLLDDKGVFCPEMKLSAEASGWEIASPMLADVDPNDRDVMESWTKNCSAVLEGASSIIAPSESAREIYLKNAPALAGKEDKIHAVAHGRDFFITTETPANNSLATKKSVRVLCLGALDRHKGGPLLRALKSMDDDHLLDFHFVGRENPKLSSCGEQHGQYSRHDVVGLITQVEPAYAVILSTWGETFSYTLSECWAAGIPVLVLDLGAPAERIRKFGGGWIQKDPRPVAVYERMIELGKDLDELNSKRREIAGMQPVSCAEMALNYDELYHRALSGDSSSREKWAIFTPDGDAGSTFIRTFLPLDHPTGRAIVQPHYLKNKITADYLAAYLERNGIDRILVQRAPFEDKKAAAPILEAGRQTRTAISIDLDDDLFQVADSHPDAEEYRDSVDALRDLAEVANRITVSTSNLKEALSWIGNAEVVVAPNRLDERLWESPLSSIGERPPSRDGKLVKDGEITLGYFGTYTHGSDLDLAKEGILRAREELAKQGITLRLEVVGALLPTAGEKEDAWFTRVDLPNNNAYPDFVPWLREQAQRWDVGIAPLQDTPLNHSKSAIKLLEYAALGIPSIASAIGEYPALADEVSVQLIAQPESTNDWCDAILAQANQLAKNCPYPENRFLKGE